MYIPMVDLPFNDSIGSYCGTLQLYLIPESVEFRSSVTVGSVRKFVEGDSTITDTSETVTSPYVALSTDLCLPSPNMYLTMNVAIPREFADGRQLRYGYYTLGGIVSVDGDYHSELRLDRLWLE